MMTGLRYPHDHANTLAAFPYLEKGVRSDRKLVWMAVFVAFLLHLIAGLISLPERARPTPPPRPLAGPIVWQQPLPPPPLRPADSRPFAQPPRSLPVPSSVPIEIDRLVESPEPEAIALPGENFLTGAISAPETVIPTKVPYLEGTPGLVLPVALPGRVTPEYPLIAVHSRSEGEVLLHAIIGIDGSVRSIEVIQAPNPDLGFSQAAIEAVSRWNYRPGRLQDRPVPVRLTVLVAFNLN